MGRHIARGMNRLPWGRLLAKRGLFEWLVGGVDLTRGCLGGHRVALSVLGWLTVLKCFGHSGRGVAFFLAEGGVRLARLGGGSLLVVLHEIVGGYCSWLEWTPRESTFHLGWIRIYSCGCHSLVWPVALLEQGTHGFFFVLGGVVVDF